MGQPVRDRLTHKRQLWRKGKGSVKKPLLVRTTLNVSRRGAMSAIDGHQQWFVNGLVIQVVILTPERCHPFINYY